MVVSHLYNNEPPDLQSRLEMNPTLILSWWCTLFSLTVILIRLFGRWIRTERLFREDWIMFYSIIPLMLRMAFVHVILIWGTNNTKTTGLTEMQIHHRETGSRLVLAARIFYAAYIWVAKWTVLEFLKRLIGKSWAKSYEVGLRFIYGFLIITYIGVVVGTLSECQPFSHYWQVVPDPGPKCREGLVQLIVMGVCDMLTDVVLIVFPIPLVWQSSMRFMKKVSLILLFLLSVILIAITAYRIPSTISRRSSQQYRSLLASLEILAASGVANAIAIGSFIRDKGVKKAKFRVASVDETSSIGRTMTRTRTRSVTHHHWGSDEDLAKGVGVSLPGPLRHGSNKEPRLAEPAAPHHGSTDLEAGVHQRHGSTFGSSWNFASASRGRRRNSIDSISSTSTDIKLRDLKTQLHEPVSPSAELDTPSKMGFFDVGGLVANPESPSSLSRQTSIHEARRMSQPNTAASRSGSKAFLSDIGGLLSRHSHIREEDETHSDSTSSPTRKGRSPGRRSPGRSPMRLRGDSRKISRSRRLPSQMEEDEEPMRPRPSGPDDLTFVDAGGLLR
ncbi:hypothetical protein LTR41_009566 [Exophiala xenobiotica]|nr:hypothetical protein LTR41_009566 [Exophiala xenobiotica]